MPTTRDTRAVRAIRAVWAVRDTRESRNVRTRSDLDGTGEAGRPATDRGSAVVDFVLVGGLLVLLVASVMQLALVQHVRTTLVDCAAEGARYAALADRTPQDGVDRARMLIAADLSPDYGRDVTARRTVIDGLDVVEVQVTAPLPVVGLLGPSDALTVVGHALAEAP